MAVFWSVFTPFREVIRQKIPETEVSGIVLSKIVSKSIEHMQLVGYILPHLSLVTFGDGNFLL